MKKIPLLERDHEMTGQIDGKSERKGEWKSQKTD